MSLPHAILTALLEEDLTGYELAKQFDVSFGFFWHASHQQIYRELKRLHEDGLVAVDEVSQEGKPDKRIYSATKKGKNQLLSWLQTDVKAQNTKDELFIRLYNVGRGRDEAIVDAVRQRLDRHKMKLALYRRIETNHYSDPKRLSKHKKGIYLSLLAGIMQQETGIAWCEEALSLLQV